jgi:hypothetical protein
VAATFITLSTCEDSLVKVRVGLQLRGDLGQAHNSCLFERCLDLISSAGLHAKLWEGITEQAIDQYSARCRSINSYKAKELPDPRQDRQDHPQRRPLPDDDGKLPEQVSSTIVPSHLSKPEGKERAERG